MPKSEVREENETTEVGKATKYCLYSAWERKLLRAHPSPSVSRLCPSTLRLHGFRHSVQSKHLFATGRGGWQHRGNSTHLRSSQWSPRPPCSSWQPGLCGQICWHSGTTCRRRFRLPSGSSFWAVAGPGWWSSVWQREWDEMPRKTLISQPPTPEHLGYGPTSHGWVLNHQHREQRCIPDCVLLH